MSRILLLCSMALLGCTLIDQQTFNPQAGVPYQVPTAQTVAVVPLLTVDLTKPNPDYAQALQQAVGQAVGRKRDAEFDVVSVVPANGTPAQQLAAATGITGDAREIARAINRDGVDDNRVHLGARADAAVVTRQVQVFVR